jgi:hypothetical protein
MRLPDWDSWRVLQIAFWALAGSYLLSFMGPRFIHQFWPGDRRFLDFSQEWLSAKNYWAGTPVYADQAEAIARHTGITPDHPEETLPWNAHPPAVTMLTLPFGKLNYRDAHLLWNLLTFPLFLVSLWLIVRELKLPLHIWSPFPAVALLLVCGPVYFQLLLAQLNFPILFLMTLAWVADRHGRLGWAGAALGVAAGLKLYPLFAFSYFFFSGRWKAILTGAIAFLLLNGMALLVFGAHEFETYIREVIPSLMHYQSSWRNTTLNGFWLRLFDPDPQEKIVPLIASHTLGKATVMISRLMVVAVVAWVSWRAKTIEGRDRAYAATLVGTILVSPFAWTHYFILLALPLGLVWMRLPEGRQRWLFWLTVVILWSPENLYFVLVDPVQGVAAMNNSHEPLHPLLNLTVLAVFTYALVILLILVLRTPAYPVESAVPATKTSIPGETPKS